MTFDKMYEDKPLVASQLAAAKMEKVICYQLELRK